MTTATVYLARPRTDAAWPQALHPADYRREHATVTEPPASHWEHVRAVPVTLPVGWEVAMSAGGDEQVFDERGRCQTLAVVAGRVVAESMDHDDVILGVA